MTGFKAPDAFTVRFESEGLGGGFAGLGEAFRRDVAEPLTRATSDLSAVFDRTFAQIERTLTKAARTGEVSFKQMVGAILSDLSRLAFEKFVAKPVTGFLEQALGSILNFGGGRAVGGPVRPSEAYLVGERGPELFVPGSLGAVRPLGRAGGGVTVHIHTPDVEGLKRSEAQVAAMLARAVRRGGRKF